MHFLKIKQSCVKLGIISVPHNLLMQHRHHTRLLSLSHFAWKRTCNVCVWGVQGRDANRKLQRSIKAGKQRERMPSLVEQLRQVLTHWQMENRQPFTYDGWDYKVSCPHVAVAQSENQSGAVLLKNQALQLTCAVGLSVCTSISLKL